MLIYFMVHINIPLISLYIFCYVSKATYCNVIKSQMPPLKSWSNILRSRKSHKPNVSANISKYF